jgi:hypothetical protein
MLSLRHGLSLGCDRTVFLLEVRSSECDRTSFLLQDSS